MPAIALRREAGRIRDLAVTMVDGKHGFTMEFAHSPEQHASEYDDMEQLLKAALATSRLKLSRG